MQVLCATQVLRVSTYKSFWAMTTNPVPRLKGDSMVHEVAPAL